ncbi:MAG: hypothetical protein ACTSPA_06025 [Promethearchaeota archaeon]
MALTTSDELHKQLTVIFGFSGQLDIEVGEIIGIGKLSEHETKKLTQSVLRFLNNYNSMLKDYAGCTLYSIEFELENLGKRNLVSLMPKSMLFIPGTYKDCNTLMLLLAPEMSLVDYSKSRKAVDDLGKLYFEVEEAIDRPELEKEQRREVLKNFAKRFALKLQGNVIKGKWNRKMIGITSGIKEDLYLSVNIKKEVKWKNKEIVPLKSNFSVSKLKMMNNEKFDFMKHWLNQSTSVVIAKNTCKLTANLLQLANTGTISETQKQILIAFLKSFIDYSEQNKKLVSFDQFKKEIESFYKIFEQYMENFKVKSTNFIKSGELKPLNEINSLYLKELTVEETTSVNEKCVNYLAKITHNHISTTKYRYHSKEKVRASEFANPILNIDQNTQLVLKKIKNSVPFYIQQYLFDSFFSNLLELLQKEFDLIHNKPIKALSVKYLEKYEKYLNNQLEKSYSQILATNQKNIYLKFKEIAKNTIGPFINSVNIEIKDLVDFCNIILSDNLEMQPYLDHLMKFQDEIEFLWGFILRSSTFQRFLKEYPGEEIFDPEHFANRFIEFLQKKRLGGLQLKWKNYIFQWINTFKYEFQPKYIKDKEEKIIWPKTKIISSFIDFIGKKVEEETTIQGFLNPLKRYLDNIAMSNIKNKFVLEILEAYKLSLEIVQQFPDYLRQVFNKAIENRQEKLFPQTISAYIGDIPDLNKILSEEIEEKSQFMALKRSLYSFIIETELKYYSKLIAKPKQIILQNIDNKLFQKKILQHRIEFDTLGDNYMKMSIFSNFKDVYPRY